MGVGTVVWGLVSRWLIVAGRVGDKVNDESKTLLGGYQNPVSVVRSKGPLRCVRKRCERKVEAALSQDTGGRYLLSEKSVRSQDIHEVGGRGHQARVRCRCVPLQLLL